MKNLLALLLLMPLLAWAGVTNPPNQNAVKITGGTIDGTPIGNTTKAAVGATTVTATGPVIAGTTNYAQGSLGTNATQGTVLMAKTGTVNDLSIINPANNTYFMSVPTGTANVNFTGNIAAGAVTGTSIAATNGIIGSTNGTDAPAGTVGEYSETQGVGVPLTSGSFTTITSKSLSAGDYQITTELLFNPTSTTSITVLMNVISCSLNSAAGCGLPSSQFNAWTANFTSFVPGYAYYLPPKTARILFNTPSTIYCNAAAVFTVSTMTATCVLKTLRIR